MSPDISSTSKTVSPNPTKKPTQSAVAPVSHMELGLAKPVSLANGIVSKVVGRNADEAALPYHQDLMCCHNKIPWSHIDLSLAGFIQGISYLIQVESYSKWPEVILLKSATTGTSLMYWAMSYVDVQIWVHYFNHLRSRKAIISSEPKTGPTEIYLGACYLCCTIPKFRKPCAIIGPIVIPDASESIENVRK
ncbi:hypothetical protein ACTXT7_006676 [Hymenolepis weldensis]